MVSVINGLGVLVMRKDLLAVLVIVSIVLAFSKTSCSPLTKANIITSSTNGEYVLSAGYLSVGRNKTPFIAFVPPDRDHMYAVRINTIFITYLFNCKIFGKYLYAVGTVYIPSSLSYDILLVKMTLSGDVIWAKTFGGDKFDAGTDLVLLPNGNIILVGNTYSFSRLGDADVILILMDGNGKPIKAKVLGTMAYDDTVRKIKRMKDGNYILLGETWSYNVSLSDAFLVKIDNSLNVLWSYSYGGSSFEEAADLIEFESGELWVVGVSRSFIMGGNDGFILRLGEYGNIISVVGIGWKGDDGFLSIAKDKNSIYVVGYTSIRESAGDPLVLVLSKNGSISQVYIFAHEGFDTFYTVNVNSGHITMVGKISLKNDTLIVVDTKELANITSIDLYTQIHDVTKIEFLKVKNYENSIAKGSWIGRIQPLNITSNIQLATHTIQVTIDVSRVPKKVLAVYKGEYIKRVSFWEQLREVLEANVPIVILSIPFVTFLVIIIALKVKKILSKLLEQQILDQSQVYLRDDHRIFQIPFF